MTICSPLFKYLFAAALIGCCLTGSCAGVDEAVLTIQDGGARLFRVTRHLPGLDGRSVFIAEADNGDRAVLLRRSDGGSVAKIRSADGTSVRTVLQDGAGKVRSRRIDPGCFRGGCLQTSNAVARSSSPVKGYFVPVDPPESDGKDNLLHIIDILVAYDAPAVTWLEDAGLTPADFAEIEVAKMNAVLENSGLLKDVRFRLTGVRTLSVKVADLGKGNDGRFRSALDLLDYASQQTLQPGSDYRGVIEARYSCGADIAVVLAHTGTTSGTLGASYGFQDSASGWDSKSNLAYRGRTAFCVCEIASVEAGYVMVHEVGHVLGAGHFPAALVNPAQIDPGPQLFGYSSAHLFDYAGERYFTIMGYPFDGYEGTGFIPVGYFSSPELTYHDGERDTDIPLGVANARDNVRTIRTAYQYVAKYRKHVVPPEDGSEIAVTVKASEGGTAGGGGLYFEGEQVSISAKASSGHLFVGWYEIGGDGATNVFSLAADPRSEKCSFTAGTNNLDILARFIRKDKKLDPVNSVTPLIDVTGFRAGVPFSQAPAFAADSLSKPTFSVSGLPTGLRFTASTCTLSGTPTKPGRFKTTVTARNQSSATFKTNFVLEVANWRDAALPLDETYGPFIPGVPQELDFSEFAVGCAVSGLPSGLKWTKTKGTITGAPSRPGTNVVIFTRTDTDPETKKRIARKASATFMTGPYPRLTLTPDGAGKGKLTGGGLYAANKTVTLRATQDTKTKSAFAGWWDADGNRLSLEASFKYVMPSVDTEVFGRFVTKEDDVDSMVAGLGNRPLSDENPLVLTNLCGVAFSRTVDSSALSKTTVSVSGLPTGLKYTSKNGIISGSPTRTSTVSRAGVTTPSKIKIKVTTAGKNVKTYPIEMYVMPLPDWAVGTFNGGGDALTATLTSQKTGKISGKLQEAANTWTMSASSFLTGDYDDFFGATNLTADVILKCGRNQDTNTVEFLPSGMAGTACGDCFWAARSLWSTTDYKDFAKVLKAAGTIEILREEGEFKFKFTTSGTVTVVAKFAGGYSPSVSAPLAVVTSLEDGFRALVFLHYPPNKTRKFAGFDACAEVTYDGNVVEVRFVNEDLKTHTYIYNQEG